MSVVRYEHDINNLKQRIWIPENTNLSDYEIKPNRSLTNASQILICATEIPID